MAWSPIPFASIRELAVAVMDKSLASQERGTGVGFVWRGEPEVYDKGIVSRIERCQPPMLTGHTDDAKLRQETDWYDEWWRRMLPLMLTQEVRSPRRPDRVPDLEWLNFAAHHGCHTRLIDWSFSPWVALYFACSRSLHKPGRVWGFDADALAKHNNSSHWRDLGVGLLPNGFGEHDISSAAFSPKASRWIVTQYNWRAPSRMAAQHGLFTIAGQLGESHDLLLDAFVPDGSKFTITIQSSDKPGLLGFLRSMGIHHQSLQYPMLDQVAGDIAQERQ